MGSRNDGVFHKWEVAWRIADSAAHDEDVTSRAILPDSLRLRAHAQGGVLTAAQLTAAGVSRAVIRGLTGRGRVHIAHGILCFRRPTWESLLWSGLLRGGAGAVAGAEAATHLNGITRREPGHIVIWLPRTSRRVRFAFEGWSIEYRVGDRPAVGKPPRLPPAASLVDYARDATEDELIHAVATGISRGLLSPDEVIRAFVEPARVRHRAAVLLLTSTAGEGIESILEWRYLWHVERAHRLPAMVRQDRRLAGARFDGTYPDHGLVVELDGREFHDTAQDRLRDNRTMLNLGWTTLRYGWSDVLNEPCRVANEVGFALQQRGWEGRAVTCPRCRGRPPPRVEPPPGGVAELLEGLRGRARVDETVAG
jgi:hypothetical protein